MEDDETSQNEEIEALVSIYDNSLTLLPSSSGKAFEIKVRFLYQCSDHLSHSKNFTSLFPLTFLSKHISLYALGRLK